jgi:dipeptidyl aminopeptidase/acylaminoacyl peptidase
MVNTISRGGRSDTPYVLVDTHSDVQDHGYLLYNTITKKQTLLGEAHPDIDATSMSRMEMVRYKTRDGAQVPLFITVPSQSEKKKRPTVVLTGSQQFQRNGYWQWNAEVQFLASRGYVVLQPEARGIGGYGQRHASGGQTAQDDIADALKWAEAQGYTDPARVCIIGTAYGGYAAMMELVQHPDIYQCGVSWSGMVTHADAPLLDKAKHITKPVLLAYGKDDQSVPQAQGRKLYEAIHAANASAEWISYDSTVEDRKTLNNRIDLWRRIEAFLAKNIGAATPGS